jgi:DNA-binding transcriptional LysR family regulator
MKPFLKLAKVWPWLPHFRVVAEVESLSRAARRFGMTSAALSKAIRTLENLLDVELFDRAGGKLRLNDQGRALLDVVRASMRDLDDAIAAIHAPSDTLRVAVDPAFSMLLFATSTTNLEIVDVPVEIAASLVRGDVDVVVHVERVSHPDLDSARIALLERSLFGVLGKGTNVPELASDFAEEAYCVFPREELRGQGAVTLSSLAHAIAWVTSGRGVAVLPSAIGRAFGLESIEIGRSFPPVALWTTIRRPRAARSAAAEWRELVRDHCATV